MDVPAGAAALDRGKVASPHQSHDRSALIAAHREGLGMAAVVVICGEAGNRIAAAGHDGGETLTASESVQARWWCRRGAQAERIAAAANARLRRRDARSGKSRASAPAIVPASGESSALPLAYESIARAAKQFDVALRTDQELDDEAAAIIARVDAEFARLQRAGELRSVNKSYQKYRIETSGRGERVMRYHDWMRKYREDLVRKLASTLRYF